MCTCLDERIWLRLCLELAARRIVQLEAQAQRGTGAIIDVTATRKDTPMELPIPPDGQSVVPNDRTAYLQVGWRGQSGTVYAMDDEAGVRSEPAGFAPLWLEVTE